MSDKQCDRGIKRDSEKSDREKKRGTERRKLKELCRREEREQPKAVDLTPQSFKWT